MVLNSRERDVGPITIFKAILVEGPTYPAIMSLVKKFDVAGSVEDLPRKGRSVKATTAEHWTESVA